MRRLAFGVPVLLAALASCRGSHEAHEDTKATPEVPATRTAAAPDDLLRIDPEMIRDLRITTTAVEQRPGGDAVTALGEIRVDESAYAEVGTSMDARVSRLLASVGDAVGPGDRLIELSSSEVGRVRGELRSAQARAELARRALERKRQLAADRIISPRELQEAEAASQSADAELRAAEGASQAVSSDGQSGGGASLVLRSPIAGTIIERTVVLGQRVDREHPLFRIADLSKLWLVAHVFERDALRIRPNAPARVSFAAMPGKFLSASVVLVGREVDATSRTIPVRIALANPGQVLRPGMSATASISLGDPREEVLAVPAAALQRVADRWCVFLPKDEGAFEIRPVGRGRELGGEVEVLSGLKRGETVVVDGAFLLKAEAEKSRGEGAHHEH